MTDRSDDLEDHTDIARTLRQVDARRIDVGRRVIEAGWLAAIVVPALYFGLYTSHQFDPDKILLFRSIVLMTLVAEAFFGCDPRPTTAVDWRRTVRRWRERNPMFAPVAGYLAAYALSTAASIAPTVSVFGFYERFQGLYTLLTYAALVVVLSAHLKTREQIDRLVTTMLTASVPIAIYGVAQHYGRDPIAWNMNVESRPISTMGNPIFLGAYLLMVVPFTGARLAAALNDSRDPNTPDASGWRGPALAWSAVVAAQNVLLAVVVMWSEKPGVWWLAPGMCAAFLLLAAMAPRAPRSRTLARFEAAALCVLTTLQVTAIVLTQSRGPLLGLLAASAAFGISLARATGRAVLGRGTAALAVAALLLVAFAVIGGPRSGSSSNATYVGRMGRLTDVGGSVEVRMTLWRATIRLFQNRPPIGLRADPLRPLRNAIGYGPETLQLALNPVYSSRLQQLEGNAAPDRNHNDALDHLAMTGVIGLVAYLALVVAALRLGWKILTATRPLDERLLAAAAIAALVGHIVETQTGIAIAATRASFFVMLGLLVALRVRCDPEASPSTRVVSAAPAVTQANRRSRNSPKVRGPVRPGEVAGPFISRHQPILAVASFIATGALLEALVAAGTISSLRALVFLSFGWLVVGLWAWAAVARPSIGGDTAVARSWPVTAATAMVAMLGIVANLDAMAADVHHKQGVRADERRAFVDSIGAYTHAVRLQRREPFYLVALGRSYLDLAITASTNGSQAAPQTIEGLLDSSADRISALGRVGLLTASETALKRALELQPLDPDHYANLGRLYRIWGDTNDDAKLTLAEKYFSDAVAIRPEMAQLHSEFSTVLLAEGRIDRALEQARLASRLDPGNTPARIGLGDLLLQQGNGDAALAEYRTGLAANPAALSDPKFERRVAALIAFHKADGLLDAYRSALNSRPPSAAALKAYAYVADRLDRPADAAAIYRAALRLDPADWRAASYFATSEEKLGRIDEAAAALQEAIAHAPAGQNQYLRQRLARLRSLHDSHDVSGAK